jgi:hypothetical protein
MLKTWRSNWNNKAPNHPSAKPAGNSLEKWRKFAEMRQLVGRQRDARSNVNADVPT